LLVSRVVQTWSRISLSVCFNLEFISIVVLVLLIPRPRYNVNEIIHIVCCEFVRTLYVEISI